METRYVVARLKALVDQLEKEAEKQSNNALAQTEGSNSQALRDGMSLGIQYSRRLVDEVRRELLGAQSRLAQR